MGDDQVGDTCHWECQLRSSKEIRGHMRVTTSLGSSKRTEWTRLSYEPSHFFNVGNY